MEGPEFWLELLYLPCSDVMAPDKADEKDELAQVGPFADAGLPGQPLLPPAELESAAVGVSLQMSCTMHASIGQWQ